MIAHRIFLIPALAVALLIVSCTAPVAPTSAPTQPASPSSSSAQSLASSSASSPSTSPAVIPTQAPTQTTAPTSTVVPTSIPTKAATATTSPAKPTGTAKMNMDEIFPPGSGREAVLDNCTSCHTFVPLVVLQMTQSQWERNARDHRDRVPRMTDADFKAAYDYLAKNFNPDRPVPKLPKELLDTWTDY